MTIRLLPLAMMTWMLVLVGGYSHKSYATTEIPQISENAAIVIHRNPASALTGAKNADVLLVEYFDYNCSYCKKLAPALQTLLAKDGKVALIYKDWPILGETSIYAARAALAAEWQGKYLLAHETLLNGPHLASDAQIDTLLQHQGIDLATLKLDQQKHASEIDARLTRIATEAHALGIQGTPGLLVGRMQVPGNADADQLEQFVVAARRNP